MSGMSRVLARPGTDALPMTAMAHDPPEAFISIIGTSQGTFRVEECMPV
jgi:hypothetical protein